MKIFILIIILYAGAIHNGGPATIVQEFNTKQSCEAAAETVTKQIQELYWSSTPGAVCLQK